jgi:LytS/YehU family sensor histidine kinase
MPTAHGWAFCQFASGGKLPMQTRRKFVLTLTAAVVAMGFVVASVIADELLGTITKVDVDGKKITVVDKDTDKEVEVTITDETEYVTKKGNMKVDLDKLEKRVKKAQDAGKKGVDVKVTHENKVASKLEFQKKKGGGKKKSD